MTGVAVGVMSITAILALGAGASKIVSEQVTGLGGNIAVIQPVNTHASDDPLSQLSQLHSNSSFTASTLTEADLNILLSNKYIESAAPLMLLSGKVAADTVAPAVTQIVASTPELAVVNDLDIRVGQFLDDTLKFRSAVIGPQTSVDIFGTEESIGKTLSIKGVSFTVIGVLNRANNPINYSGVDFDNSVLITLSEGKSLNHDATQIQQINIRSHSVDSLQAAVVSARKDILKNHSNQADFTILTGEEIAQPTSQFFYAVAGVTTAIAAISLLVGGIGIMNIMLVSVVERTREIGIRKALGASSSDIVWQFLIEALAISFSGGIVGIISGYALSFVISIFLTFDPAVNWMTLIIGIGVSGIIGGIFGLYPAIRAARKDPINALRQYD